MNREKRLRMARMKCAWLVLALLPLLGISSARAAVPVVEDRAGLFSARAVQKANQIVENIYQQTKPAKEVVVETLSSLPTGIEADQEAERTFAQRHLSGLLILIVKNPHKLAVTVGRSTQERFQDGAALRNVMLSHFKRDDYDGGLLAGLQFAEQSLLRKFPESALMQKNATTEERPVLETPHASRSWLGPLLFLVGGVVLLLVLRSRRQAAPAATPYSSRGGGFVNSAPSGWGTAPSSGGGWAKPVLGGVAGAVAGNWLYDRFVRGDEHSGVAHAAESGHPSLPSDDGDVGSTFGGSGGGNDWGGGDIGGGDGGGGGDW